MKASSILVLLGLSTVLMAHESPVGQHAPLVPIPKYSSDGLSTTHSLREFIKLFDRGMQDFMSFALDANERKDWSNLPARFVQRPGISIGEMSDSQRKALFRFLSASLGETGYKKVADVLAAEAYLNGEPQASFMKWNPANYWFSVYGSPSDIGDWGWQFGGHHLTLNFSVTNGLVNSMSPSFIGTEPAIFAIDGLKHEAVIDMHQAGFAVYESLDTNQKSRALLRRVPNDVVTGPGRDGLVPPMVGILGAEMTSRQKSLLMTAIQKWVSIQPDGNASRRMEEIARDIDQTAFAWTGSEEVDSDTYFRIQGPTVIVELLSTAANLGDTGNGQGHYHTMYRNPKFDYGEKGR